MKYMRWSDLEPRDVLQFTDDYLKATGFSSEYNNKDFIISKITCEKNFIKIYVGCFCFYIDYNGIDYYRKVNCLKFKLIKLKDEQ